MRMSEINNGHRKMLKKRKNKRDKKWRNENKIENRRIVVLSMVKTYLNKGIITKDDINNIIKKKSNEQGV